MGKQYYGLVSRLGYLEEEVGSTLTANREIEVDTLNIPITYEKGYYKWGRGMARRVIEKAIARDTPPRQRGPPIYAHELIAMIASVQARYEHLPIDPNPGKETRVLRFPIK